LQNVFAGMDEKFLLVGFGQQALFGDLRLDKTFWLIKVLIPMISAHMISNCHCTVWLRKFFSFFVACISGTWKINAKFANEKMGFVTAIKLFCVLQWSAFIYYGVNTNLISLKSSVKHCKLFFSKLVNSLKEELLTKIRQTSIIMNCRLFVHKAVEMEQCVFVHKHHSLSIWIKAPVGVHNRFA